MAKVTITLEDTDDDSVDTKIEFNPPALKDEIPTQAQAFALHVLEVIHDHSVDGGGTAIQEQAGIVSACNREGFPA